MQELFDRADIALSALETALNLRGYGGLAAELIDARSQLFKARLEYQSITEDPA